MLCVVVILSLLSILSLAQERIIPVKYSIQTLIGTGSASFNGDGLSGLATSINSPMGVFYDENTLDLYFSDSFNNRVRVLRNETGLVETIVGNGVQGYSGEGILAINSSLSRPFGLFVSNNKDIYIAGNLASRIHKYSNTDKKLYTFAGTGVTGFNGDGLLANQTRLNQPLDVKILNQDSNNMQFIIAETYGNRIRSINGSTLITKVIVGTGVSTYNGDNLPALSTNLYYPWVTIMDNTDMYFTSIGHNLLRRYDLKTGNVITVAGVSGNATHSGDGGLAQNATFFNLNGVAISPVNGDFFICETNWNGIRKISRKTGIISTIAGTGTGGNNGNNQADATKANLSSPRAIIATKLGELIFTDSSNNMIRKLTPVCPSGYVMDAFQTICTEACYGILYNNSQVCGGNGKCQSIDKCVCENGFYGLDCSLPICFKAANGACVNDTSGVSVENIETSQLSNKSISINSGNNSTASSVISIAFPSDFSSYISNQTSFSAVSLLTAVSSGEFNLTSSNSSTFSLVSNIITISLALTNGNTILVSNLEKPIQISFQKPISFTGNLTCMYFDELTSEWKSDGVKTVIETLTVNCLTSHLTSFSVIDINLKKEITKPNNPRIESSTVSNQTKTTDSLSQEAIIAISVSIAGTFIVCCVVAILISVVVCLIRRKAKH